MGYSIADIILELGAFPREKFIPQILPPLKMTPRVESKVYISTSMVTSISLFTIFRRYSLISTTRRTGAESIQEEAIILYQ